MIGAGRRVDPGNIRQRGNASVAALRHDLQPLGDQRPIHAGERNDIAHGAERNQIEHLHQVRLRPARPVPVGAAQLPVHRNRQQERDTNGGKGTMDPGLVQAVRIHHGIGAR